MSNSSLSHFLNYLKNGEGLFMLLAKLGFKKNTSDDIYLKHVYKAVLGYELCLDNPKTFNEKLQWLKINDRADVYTNMVDKYEAKKYVSDILGSDYIIPNLGVWDSFDDIDFDKLPNQFVLKCTHDSGGLVICRDKSKFNKKAAERIIKKSLKNNYYYLFREWPYLNVKPRIIAEVFMDDNSGLGLTDYKFFCFNGKARFLYISTGLENHKTAKISFVNLDWTFAPFEREDYAPFNQLPDKPKSFDKMIAVAEKLSNGIPFLRVDLYEIDGRIYFSELTFSPCGGFTKFKNYNQDLEIGKYLVLPRGVSDDYSK